MDYHNSPVNQPISAPLRGGRRSRKSKSGCSGNYQEKYEKAKKTLLRWHKLYLVEEQKVYDKTAEINRLEIELSRL